MKKITIAIILMAAFVASAGEIQTLVNDSGRWRGSIKPEFKLTQIRDETAELIGIEVGPSMNRGLYLGLGAYGLVNDVDTGASGKLDAFDVWYGGFTVDYTLYASQVLHGSAGFLIGGGQINVRDVAESDSASLFVFEPGVNLMVNVTKGIELGVGASYRFMNGSDIDGFKNSDLSGPAASLFVRWNEE
jgi:hypothetical protein